MFVVARQNSLLVVGIILLILLTPMYGDLTSMHESTTDVLYLLSGTPTNYGDQTFSGSLYQVNASKKLELVREVAPQAEGLYSVHADGGVIFVTHPHITPTTVSIIHTADPLRKDDLVFNPKGLTSIQNREALAEPKPSSVDELFALAADAAHPNRGTVVSVSSSSSTGNARVNFDSWDEYTAMRVDGNTGGPALGIGPFGSIVDGKFAISVFGRDIAVETLPPFLRQPTERTIAWFMVVSSEYSVLALANTSSGSPTLGAVGSRDMLVHERTQKRWKKIVIEGTSSRLRLFGSWLATIVGTENPDHKPSPGRENERASSANGLPSVREQYATFAGYESWLPGILVLQNLADDRKIRIETGQEDSEILLVEADTVLYRINDTIYQAKIAGEELKESVVVVKDEDVPEIHWAFWSK
jgi:hypothetical protein